MKTVSMPVNKTAGTANKRVLGGHREMAVVKELIRTEENGAISFGDYELAQKSKLSDYQHQGDMYKVKTFKQISSQMLVLSTATLLARNCRCIRIKTNRICARRLFLFLLAYPRFFNLAA